MLFALPDATTVWPAHDYQGRTHSTIGDEKASNPRIAGKTQAEFVAIMDALNLPKPKRIDEAVPANLTSGLRHDAGGGPLLEARPAAGYAGDVSPQLAYKWWRSGDAVLVDVRTDAEREWVGFIPGRRRARVEAVAGHGDERQVRCGASRRRCRKARRPC